MTHSSPIACLLVILASAQALAQQGSKRPPVQGAGPSEHREYRTPGENGEPERIHRLESVTWDPMHCELTWVVSTGIRTGREYTPSETQAYKIAMDTATMQFGSERRRFEMQEASNVHLLMDMITRYAAESTIWWDQGEGEKIEESGPVAKTRRGVDNGAMKKPLSPSLVDGSPGRRTHTP